MKRRNFIFFYSRIYVSERFALISIPARTARIRLLIKLFNVAKKFKNRSTNECSNKLSSSSSESIHQGSVSLARCRYIYPYHRFDRRDAYISSLRKCCREPFLSTRTVLLRISIARRAAAADRISLSQHHRTRSL